MIDFKIRISRNLITPALKKIRKDLDKLPLELERKLIDLTPLDTGHAKKSTRLVNKRTIRLAYAYAKVLDRGRHQTPRGMRGSLQAPKGMTKPLRKWYRLRIRQLLQSAKRRV